MKNCPALFAVNTTYTVIGRNILRFTLSTYDGAGVNVRIFLNSAVFLENDKKNSKRNSADFGKRWKKIRFYSAVFGKKCKSIYLILPFTPAPS